jgi:hypothetical protein
MTAQRGEMLTAIVEIKDILGLKEEEEELDPVT